MTSSQLQAQEAEAQARDHDMQCVRDEGGPKQRRDDLESTRIGQMLLELLAVVDEVDRTEARRWGRAVESLRQRYHTSTDEERLAAKLRDLLGDPSDCYPINEVLED